MVHLLVLVKSVVDCLLDGADGPKDCPDSIVVLVSLPSYRLNVSEPVIFKRVPNDFNVAVMEVKVIAAVLWLIRTDRDWVFVGSEHEEVALDLLAEFGLRGSSHNRLNHLLRIGY